jgi:hypothetical protein
VHHLTLGKLYMPTAAGMERRVCSTGARGAAFPSGSNSGANRDSDGPACGSFAKCMPSSISLCMQARQTAPSGDSSMLYAYEEQVQDLASTLKHRTILTWTACFLCANVQLLLASSTAR